MRHLASLLCATLLVCGCRGDNRGGAITPPPDGDKPGQIAIVYPSSGPMTSAGETRSAIGVVLDANEWPVSPPPTISWSSSAPAVVTVNPTGPIATITAVDDGTATITAVSGSAKGSIMVSVHRAPASAAVSVP